jgi:DNA replication protein DnaC
MPGVFEFDADTTDDDSERLETLIRRSNLPPDTRLTKRLFTFEKVLGREEGLEAAIAFIRGEIDPPLLLLYGLPGRSKTHLALAIGWVFLAQLKSVSYYHVVDLLDALRQGYHIANLLGPGEFNKDSFDTISNFVKKCTLLILDDLGVQKETDWAAERLDAIIDHRYVNKLPTVVTANTLDLPERIFDRMREGRVVRLQGESYRAIMQRRKLHED